MRRWISLILMLLVMGMIIYLSNEPASASRELSSGITDKILEKFHSIVPDAYVDWDYIHHMIRKSAHFFSYMVLGVFTLLVCTYPRKVSMRATLIAMLICILFAISDELHQVFIPGRSGEIRDVLIDSTGAAIGIAGITGIKYLLNRRKQATGGKVNQKQYGSCSMDHDEENGAKCSLAEVWNDGV